MARAARILPLPVLAFAAHAAFVPGLASAMTATIHVAVIDSLNRAPVESALVRYCFEAPQDTASGLTGADGTATLQHDVITGVASAARASIGIPFPNPAGDAVFLPFVSAGKTAAETPLALYDLRGRKLCSGQGSLTLDTPLPAGSYIIAIETGGQRAARRVAALGGLSRISLYETAPACGAASTGADPATVLVRRAGYAPLDATRLVMPGANEHAFSLLPEWPARRVHGTLWNETGDSTLGVGALNFRSVGGTTSVANVGPDGSFEISFALPETTLMDVWYSGNPAYSTNTFTWCKRDVPASIGVTGTSVGVYSPDTMRVRLGDLAHAAGHFVLALSDANAANDTILGTVDHGGSPDGLVKWIPETITFVNFLTVTPDGIPIDPVQQHSQQEVIRFFAPLFVLPNGLVLARADSTTMTALPGDPTGYCFVRQSSVIGWGNTMGPPTLFYNTATATYSMAFGERYPYVDYDIGLLVREVGEANGLWDTVSGSNSRCFVGGPYRENMGLSHIGRVAWALSHTYLPHDFGGRPYPYPWE